ncbi:hypothetical protein [Francisella marina]|uniref:DUF2489 domain-containing protein n=1 Tax=Francisella marina TaxID=2249302 RepID=A0ABX5ZFP2_9GAMM|nr:hypothetical protein [Francisella marina]QEO57025.1 hypothetical protein F0R74_03840 [Francisella marina]QEO58859.1 hypothetical protein F0R75_03390 [Francisella marina]
MITNIKEYVNLDSVAVVIAILSFFVSIITIFMTRKNIASQIKAGLAQNNRQTWINEYREKTSQLLMLIDSYSMLNDDDKSRLTHFQKLSSTTYQLMLMLNSKNDKDLYELVEKIAKAAESQVSNKLTFEQKNSIYTDIYKQRESLISKTRKMLKNEWEKIKEESGIAK